jgi:hypothetical protein
VWHFAASIQPRLAVSLTAGEGQQVILSRSLALGKLMSYREVPPGQYKLAVRSATVEQSVKPAGPELIPSVTVAVANRSFQTIFLQDQTNGPKTFVVNDGTVGTGIPRGGKRLRIFDFAPGQQASLKTANEVIAPTVVPGRAEHIFPNNPGVLTIFMSNKVANGHEAQQSMEFDFNRCDSISAVLTFDRYGRLIFEAAEDARVQ